MTLQSIRLLLQDIQRQGAINYESPLLDRLCDYFGVDAGMISEIPSSHRGLARAELLARVVAEDRPDAKRRIAGFVYPHLFDLAVLQVGHTHDAIAANVLSSSVDVIVQAMGEVSDVLAAHTSDVPDEREKLPVIVGGNIAAHPVYSQQLTTTASRCSYIESLQTVGKASDLYADLAYYYLEAPAREQRAIARSFDPLHTVTQLM